MSEEMSLLMDFYRWLEAQDEITVGRTDLDEDALWHLVERYLSAARAALLRSGRKAGL